MNFLVMLIGFVVAAVLLYFLFTYETSSAASILHTVVLDGQVIYSGNTAAIVTSDGVSNVLLGTVAGLLLYNTDSKVATTLNNSVATGLAYDSSNQIFMELQGDGTLSSVVLSNPSTDPVATSTEIATGYSSLYDTTDGYSATVNSVQFVTGLSGTTTPANGNYGMIVMIIT